MKKIVVVTAFVLIALFGNAQNLIPNPSFEQFDTCPNTVGQVDYCHAWSSYRNSPDYFNVCSSDTLVSIPYNGLGYQQPATGNAYSGFFSYGNISDYREIIGTPLDYQLIIGVQYFVSFNICLSIGGYYNCKWASNKIGVLFSTIPHAVSDPIPINNFAHFYTDSVITDTSNWVFLKGSFMADSSYQFMAIGNFFDDQHTDTIHTAGTPSLGAYYFIDDVCLSTDSSYCKSQVGESIIEFQKNQVNVFPIPANEFINIRLQNNYSSDIYIFRSDGINIYADTFQSQEKINTSNFNNGLYLIKIINQGSTFFKKIIINH